MKPIDRDGFRSWLEEHPAEEVVGKANNAYCCPLTKYLEVDFVGAAYAHVQGKASEELPRWARLFVSELDHQYGTHQEEVTASQALAVLAAIPLTSP